MAKQSKRRNAYHLADYSGKPVGTCQVHGYKSFAEACWAAQEEATTLHARTGMGVCSVYFIDARGLVSYAATVHGK